MKKHRKQQKVEYETLQKLKLQQEFETSLKVMKSQNDNLSKQIEDLQINIEELKANLSTRESEICDRDKIICDLKTEVEDLRRTYEPGSELLSLLPLPKNSPTLKKTDFVPHVLSSKKSNKESSHSVPSKFISKPSVTESFNSGVLDEQNYDETSCNEESSRKNTDFGASEDFFSLKALSSDSNVDGKSCLSPDHSLNNDPSTVPETSYIIQDKSCSVLSSKHAQKVNESVENLYMQPSHLFEEETPHSEQVALVEGQQLNPPENPCIDHTADSNYSESLLSDKEAEVAASQLISEEQVNLKAERKAAKNKRRKERRKQQKKNKYLSYEKLVPSHPDGYIDVYVSNIVNPGKFWVLISGSKSTQLEKLATEMTDFYDDEKNKVKFQVTTFNVGDVVAAYHQDDTFWYRAQVLKMAEDGEKKISVFYLDFGDRAILNTDSIKILKPEYLSIPFQAIECSLAGVEPVEGEWTDNASEEFEKLVYFGRWKVIMAKPVKQMLEQTEESAVQSVKLVDTTTKVDVTIAAELVSKGHAKFI